MQAKIYIKEEKCFNRKWQRLFKNVSRDISIFGAGWLGWFDVGVDIILENIRGGKIRENTYVVKILCPALSVCFMYQHKKAVKGSKTQIRMNEYIVKRMNFCISFFFIYIFFYLFVYFYHSKIRVGAIWRVKC